MLERLKALFLGSGVARLLCLILLFALLSLLSAFLCGLREKPLELAAIVPAVASAGEVISLEGSGFGDERGSGWVELSGSRISSSAYVSWSDTCIRIIVPENYSDGLLSVRTRNGESNALVFSKKENIPQEAAASSLSSPVIQSVSPPQASIGGIVSIHGANFGAAREGSGILFTRMQEPGALSSAGREGSVRPLIVQDDFSLGYDLWSDTEIRARVPDGAASGPIYVQTARGMSLPADLRVTGMPGSKSFANTRVFLISLDVEITSIEAVQGSRILLRVPRPIASASQQNARLQEAEPAPYIEDYHGTVLQQFENVRGERRLAARHVFTVANCDVLTQIDARQVEQYDTSSPIYRAYTAPDALVPSSAPEILAALASVPEDGDSNPYTRARAIYSWLLESIRYVPPADLARSPLEALRTFSGDAYDMAILFCAMARASGVPAVPVAGIAIDTSQKSVPHWWAEFYIERFGWVPVDIGMAKGIPYQAEARDEEPAEWYFGNIDGNRVAFSFGIESQDALSSGAKIVGYPRSFSFQRIWEEASEGVSAYTSFWSVPQAAGVY